MTKPHVAILLCTHNGARFLQPQMESIRAQTHTNWGVWASDDASGDDTVALLQRCRAAWGDNRLTVLQGPAAGFTRNFPPFPCIFTLRSRR